MLTVRCSVTRMNSPLVSQLILPRIVLTCMYCWCLYLDFQVVSVCIYPELLNDKNIPADVRARADRILDSAGGRSMGKLYGTNSIHCTCVE